MRIQLREQVDNRTGHSIVPDRLSDRIPRNGSERAILTNGDHARYETLVFVTMYAIEADEDREKREPTERRVSTPTLAGEADHRTKRNAPRRRLRR